ncbi:unnamed protein product, partial [Brachionus calyciflorus]
MDQKLNYLNSCESLNQIIQLDIDDTLQSETKLTKTKTMFKQNIHKTETKTTLYSFYGCLNKKIYPLSLKVYSTDSNNYNISAHTILSQIFKNHSFYFKEKQSLIFPVGPLEIASLDIYLTFKLEYQDYLKLSSGKEDVLKNISQQSQIDFNDYILFSLKANQLLNQKYLNQSFPAWAQKNLKEIISAQNYLYNFLYGDKNIAKIMSGPLLNYIVTELKNQIFINPYILYLTDDSMLCSMLTLINSPCNSTPEMASSLIFEVSETSNKEHYVKVF